MLIMPRGMTVFCGTLPIASEGNDEWELKMATGYMDALKAVAEALMFLVDVYGAKVVLDELFDYMDVDRQVELVHDFIKYNDVDISEMSDETVRTINEHYEKYC